MRREDCVDMFKRVPELSHAYMNVVMKNQSVLTVDVMVRFEPMYLVMKGREGGTTDENRAFFVPYEEISYLRLERPVKISELKAMYGETGYVDEEDKLLAQGAALDKAKAEADGPVEVKGDAQTPAPEMPQDPASIARQNLLDRIRAARQGAGATGKLTGGTGKFPGNKK
jgi:hypothetical protein